MPTRRGGIDQKDMLIARASREAAERQGLQADTQQWGGAIVFNGAGDVNVYKSLVNIQLPDGGPPLSCLISPPTLDNNPELLTNYPTTAKLAFGSSRGQSEALITCSQGACFSIPASFLRVDVRVEDTLAAPVNLHVRGWAGKGDLGGSVRPLYRSLRLGAAAVIPQPVAPGALFQVNLPFYTRRYKILRYPATCPFGVYFTGLVPSEVDVQVGAGQQCPWIDVVSAQGSIQVLNTGVVNLYGDVICELNL